MESVQLEFTYLLTTQLESQRKYFENQMKHFEENSFIEVNIFCIINILKCNMHFDVEKRNTMYIIL